METESVSFIVNNITLVIRAPLEEAALLKTDDEYAINYITDAVAKGTLEELGLHSKDVASGLEIARSTMEITPPQNNENISQIEESPIVWSTKGKPNKIDLEAVNYMLYLRANEKYMAKFNDKRTVKMSIWNEMANEMIEAGFNVGAGDKVRQKFFNLTKSYTNYNDYVKKTTGTTPKKPPEYYEQINLILGDKHKTHPEHVINSTNKNEKEVAVPSTSKQSLIEEVGDCIISDENNKENETANETAPVNSVNQNRFKKINKTVKPKTDKLQMLSEIIEICMESNQIAKDHTNKVENILKEQNEIMREQTRQKDRMLNIMEKMFCRKRRRDSDSE